MTAPSFDKVAVLMGGWSAEREISLKSGKSVLDALLEKGINAYAIDVDKSIAEKLNQDRPDVAFVIMHGRGGEDGIIQAVLELLEIPYTGSGVLASALSMDKIRTKQVWNSIGLATPEYTDISHESDLQSMAENFIGPYMVKPGREGSSIGVSKVETYNDMVNAWGNAKKYDELVFAEQYIDGDEYSVSILNGKALPVIKLKSQGEFYDFHAKYISDETVYQCPSGLDAEIEIELQEVALKAFDALSCQGWGRVDFMVDHDGKAWLIENNTLPGMTDHSLVPMAAAASGMSFGDLVYEILLTAGN